MSAQPSPHRARGFGLELAYLRWEPTPGADDAGDVLFLLHGFLDLAWGMAPLAEALRAAGVGATLIAPDWRGHGDSAWVGAGGYYHFPDYVLDLEALTRALVPAGARLGLVGHSMGGGAASLFAAAYPERVAAFVNAEGYGPPAGSLEDGAERLRRFADAVRDAEPKRAGGGRGLRDVQEAAERLRAGNAHLSAELATFLAERATRVGDDGVRRWKFDPLHRTPSAYAFNLEQALAVWRRVQAPTLLVEGAESPMRALPDLALRRAAFAGAPLAVLEGAGHMMHQEVPDAMARRVAEHWRQARVSHP